MPTSPISVVIPYYQRAVGVLRRSLASVAAQKDSPGPIDLIVVDDASPAPAVDEVAAVSFPTGITVRVVRQANGGPGAARNAGLSAALPASRFVAFLDSDDQWHEHHLARAAQALDCGYDVFFGDHYQLDQSVGAFARAGRIKPDEHSQLPTARQGLHAYTGDMFDQILIGNPIGTSTVVYDRLRFATLRFRAEFTNAGEDYLFWMELARAGARFAFSSAIEATYGRGINVYAGSGWGTEYFALRLHNEIKFRRTVKQLFHLAPAQDKHVTKSIHALRASFAADLLHRLTHRKAISRDLLRAHWKLDPLTYAHLPLVVTRRLTGRS